MQDWLSSYYSKRSVKCLLLNFKKDVLENIKAFPGASLRVMGPNVELCLLNTTPFSCRPGAGEAEDSRLVFHVAD